MNYYYKRKSVIGLVGDLTNSDQWKDDWWGGTFTEDGKRYKRFFFMIKIEEIKDN